MAYGPTGVTVTRNKVLAVVADARAPIAIAEVAASLGMTTNGVRRHLRELVDAGYLTEEIERSSKRGRPRLVYAPAARRPGTTDPAARLATFLAEAVSSGRSVREVGRASAQGPALDDEGLLKAVGAEGFDPEWKAGADGAVLVLKRCPYAAVAAAHADVVCGLHRGIAEALAARAGRRVLRLEVVDPAVGGCRITLSNT